MNMHRLLLACILAPVIALSAATAHAQGDLEAGKQKAAACAACHGIDGNAPPGVPDNPYPDLAGQTARYLYLQLRDFK